MSNSWDTLQLCHVKSTSGELLDISGKVTLGANAQSITIDMSSFGTQHQNDPYKLIAVVRKTDTSPKTKVLKTNVENIMLQLDSLIL